jgi:hypothetical protein
MPDELGQRIVPQPLGLGPRLSEAKVHRFSDVIDRASAQGVVRMTVQQRSPGSVEERATISASLT